MVIELLINALNGQGKPCPTLIFRDLFYFHSILALMPLFNMSNGAHIFVIGIPMLSEKAYQDVCFIAESTFVKIVNILAEALNLIVERCFGMVVQRE